MNNTIDFQETSLQNTGKEMYDLITKLFPICRSITGNGVRETLAIIRNHIPLEIHEIPSGTNVFDWTIPKEWNITDAYVKNSNGEKIIDFKKTNLHVLNYSMPINKKVSLKELKEHIFTLPEYPKSIPYRTSYYEENWGFCITHEEFDKLIDDEYEVVISSALENGHLTYGEYFLKGETEDEILLSCYVCHPSMANDNLSGVSLLTFLAKYLSKKKLKYSYRFLFMPETIGAITWLHLNEKNVNKIRCGLVATCLGDRGHLTYKKTRNDNTIIDKIVEDVLKESKEKYEIVDFFPFGSDERQFSSPGFNLFMGSLTRTLYARFPEYHTSADNLDFVDSEYLHDSFEKYVKIVSKLEDLCFEEKQSVQNKKNENVDSDKNNLIFKTIIQKCEPNLGKRGLYDKIGGVPADRSNILTPDDKISLFWVLNFCDGKNSLLDISKRSKIKIENIKRTSEILMKKGLIKKI